MGDGRWENVEQRSRYYPTTTHHIQQTHHIQHTHPKTNRPKTNHPSARFSIPTYPHPYPHPSCAEAQPLYTNYPFGISVAHNGNLTNTDVLREAVSEDCLRHVNTDSDSELLLNLFAEELTKIRNVSGNFAKTIFQAMEGVMRQCEGGYSGLYMINGVGMVGFRDPNGIRPIVFGSRPSKEAKVRRSYKPTMRRG